MKKYLTFANFIALLGLATIFIYFATGANAICKAVDNVEINLFTATFGGSYQIVVGEVQEEEVLVTKTLIPCAGLLVAFILAILADVTSITTFKLKLLSLVAFGLYVAAGVLVFCTPQLLIDSNIHGQIAITDFTIGGGAIAVGIMYCVCGFFSLINFISGIAKPKETQSAY